MRRSHRVILPAVLITCALLAGVAWIALRDRSLERPRAEGVIRIGYAVEAPFAFMTPEGEVTGESPEVAKRVVAHLGIPRIEWRQTEFGRLVSELESGRIDVIAAGMFITAERAKQVAFSEPTFHVGQALLVAAGNPLRLRSYRQAAVESGARIAVLSGAVEESLLRGMGVSESRLVIVPDALTGRVAVESGMADALALSSPTLRWMTLRDQLGKTLLVESQHSEPSTKGHLGFGAFAFRKDDQALRSAWNAFLASFIGSREHLDIISAFGFTTRELPGGATIREILAR